MIRDFFYKQLFNGAIRLLAIIVTRLKLRPNNECLIRFVIPGW